jgi:hypothetical protein
LKTRKLLAMLVAVAMIVTMLPVVVFAEDDGKAVADASRIYASDDEVDADGEDEVTITVLFAGCKRRSSKSCIRRIPVHLG